MSLLTNRPILFVLNSSFPEYSGGRENWLFHVSTRLRERGHDIRILSLMPDGLHPTHYDLGTGIRLYRVRSWLHTPVGKRLTPGSLGVLRSLSVAPLFRRFLRRQALHWQPRPVVIGLDTVVIPLAMRGLEETLTFVCASKGPHADLMATQAPWLSYWLRWAEIRAYRSCQEVWSNGRDMRDYIRRQGYESIVIGNGVDIAAALRPRERPQEYASERTSFRICMVGSLLDIKGIANAVRALSGVTDPEKRGRMELYFVGKGDPRPYSALAEECGVRSQIHFLGARQDVFPYLQHADLLLCLSGGGGMSMAALESLASGVPVLAWDTPVYQQLIVNGQNGWLVPRADNKALAQGFCRALGTSVSQRRQMGQRAVESMRPYDWECVVDHIEERLHHLCGMESAGRPPCRNAQP